MSQYHQVTNRCIDPHVQQNVVYIWGGSTSRDDDGTLVVHNNYMSSYGVKSAAVVPKRGPALRNGDILVHVTDGMSAHFGQISYHKSAESLPNIHIRDNVWATVSRIIAPNQWNELWILSDTPVKVLSTGLYSPEDWQSVLDQYHAGILPTPFFAGDTDPR